MKCYGAALWSGSGLSLNAAGIQRPFCTPCALLPMTSIAWAGVLNLSRKEKRAEYGSALFQRLSNDLTKRFGKRFSADNFQRMRMFYLEYKPETIYARV